MCEIGIQIELETLFHTGDKNSADVPFKVFDSNFSAFTVFENQRKSLI